MLDVYRPVVAEGDVSDAVKRSAAAVTVCAQVVVFKKVKHIRVCRLRLEIGLSVVEFDLHAVQPPAHGLGAETDVHSLRAVERFHFI